MDARLICPTCAKPLIVARKESRPLRNRYGRTRPALWKCEDGCAPAPGFVGWLPNAPEIQPKAVATVPSDGSPF